MSEDVSVDDVSDSIPEVDSSQDNSANDDNLHTSAVAITSRATESEDGVLLIDSIKEEGQDMAASGDNNLTNVVVAPNQLDGPEQDDLPINPAEIEAQDNSSAGGKDLTENIVDVGHLAKPEDDPNSQSSPSDLTTLESVKEDLDNHSHTFPKSNDSNGGKSCDCRIHHGVETASLLHTILFIDMNFSHQMTKFTLMG